MYTGWLRRFKVDRPIDPVEQFEPLKRERTGASNERHCVISLNSTYMDVIDRRYRLRGMVATTVVTLVSTALALFALWMLVTWLPTVYEGRAVDWFMVGVLVIGFVGQFALLYRLIIGRDFFTYKYYPIRFNRRTRMVHAYTDAGPSGVISVPWDKAYFHLGHGQGETFLRDIRCHVMDGEMVKQTFAVGHYFDDADKVREIWEFIRRYMDEGPQHVVDAPASPQLHLSVADTWKNCYLTVIISLGEALLPYRTMLMPLLGPLAACRWLVLKSSKTPEWPAHVVTESGIDVADPHQLPEPEYVGQFYEGRGV
jgi:hypothetical protein